MREGDGDPPRYFVALSSGTGYLTDHTGLVETLQRQSEFDWYMAEDVPMVPTIWISVGDSEFRQLRMTRRHVGGSRTCIEEQWTLIDTRTGQVVERLTTSYAEPEPGWA